MPIYEFACDDCGHEFESFQRLSDPLPDTCPNCGKHSVHKKISAAGFRLKGGGWYETDFKSGQKKNVSGSEGAAPDSGGKESASSSDSGSDSGAAAAGSSNSGSKNSDSGSKSGGSESKPGSTTTKKD